MASAPALASVATSAHARLAVAPGANLLGLLAAIDDAPGARVVLDAADLPRALQTRTILTVLRRRADRRGKRLHLLTPSRPLWRLARLAGLDGVAADEAAAESLFGSRLPHMPADAVPAVVVGTPPTAETVTVEPEVAPEVLPVPKALGILARGDLNLEPIPALDADEGAAGRAQDLPAPRLASLVAWLDIDPQVPSTGGSGPEGPDDDGWLPAGATRGTRLRAPDRAPQPAARRATTEPRLRVVHVRDDHAWVPPAPDGVASRGAGGLPPMPEAGAPLDPIGSSTGRPASAQPPVRRPSGRAAREAMLERVRERGARRSLNPDRLERLAGRSRHGRRAPNAPSAPMSIPGAPGAVRGRIEGLIGTAPARGALVVTTRLARGAWRGSSRAAVASWRALSGVRLSAAAWQRVGSTGAVLAIVGLFTWHVVPSATVEIVPAVEPWSATVPMVVDPGARKADPAGARVPGRWIVKEATESGQASATGKRVVPDGKAGGDAVFTNRSDRQVVVPKGTIVTGGGVRFVTQSDVAVSATTFAGAQRRFGFGRVQVVAEAGGTAGNLGQSKVTVIEGPLAGQLDVQNDQAMRGGTERTVPFVSADDRRKLLETVQKAAIEKLAAQVRSVAIDPTKEQVVPLGPAGTPLTVPGVPGSAVVDATFSKGENDEAASVSVTVKARYAVTVFEAAVAQQVAQSGAAAMVAQQRPGFAMTGAVPRAQAPEVGSADAASGQVQVRVRVDATVAPVVVPSSVRDAISGRTPDEARAILATMSGVSSYRLEAWPAWSWKSTLPSLGWRIGVATAGAK